MIKLTHTRLLVSDFRASFLFYRDVMGFKSVFGDENEVYGEFETGEVMLALFRRDIMAAALGTTDRPTEAVSQDKVALIFAVDNVDAVCETLKARGVVFITEPEDRAEWGIRTAHFRDPDGNLLEIHSSLSA